MWGVKIATLYGSCFKLTKSHKPVHLGNGTKLCPQPQFYVRLSVRDYEGTMDEALDKAMQSARPEEREILLNVVWLPKMYVEGSPYEQ